MSASAVPTRTFAASVYDAYKVYRTGEQEVRALDGVTVGFEAGRFTAVMGPSGSGKSTLMQCAAGLDNLTSGRTFIGDTETTMMTPAKLTVLRREQLGFIFQSFNLVPVLTARENILLPQTLGGPKVDPGFFDQVVDTLGLRDRLHHKPKELSGASNSVSPSPGPW
ncbi:MAG: ATP-binding cassette domain-containing protein [Microthrixaceae bacterium]